MGFAEPSRSPGLLVSSYLAVSPLPQSRRQASRPGRSVFCGTFPIRATHCALRRWALPTIAPLGVRTFLRGMPLNSSPWTSHPAHSLASKRHGDHRARHELYLIIRTSNGFNNPHSARAARRRRSASTVSSKHKICFDCSSRGRQINESPVQRYDGWNRVPTVTRAPNFAGSQEIRMCVDSLQTRFPPKHLSAPLNRMPGLAGIPSRGQDRNATIETVVSVLRLQNGSRWQ
jgi:hypothetical protein